MRDPAGHPPLDEGRILASLNTHGVEYVVVGGVAARLHGATRATHDLDICVSYETDNLLRLVEALNELETRFRGIWDRLPPVSVESLRRMEIATWRTAAGDLDVLLGIPARFELTRYEELRRRAVRKELADGSVYIASLADVIASKEFSMRAQYQAGLPELRALASQGSSTTSGDTRGRR
jgi:predicted nucleotidyltransferase